jgi:uncharacterized protein (UPF0335 family)
MIDSEVCKERHKYIEDRLDRLEKESKEQGGLVADIRELVIEIKYMRTDMNNVADRVVKLERKDSDKWDKFKWAIVAALITATIALIFGVVAKYI